MEEGSQGEILNLNLASCAFNGILYPLSVYAARGNRGVEKNEN